MKTIGPQTLNTDLKHLLKRPPWWWCTTFSLSLFVLSFVWNCFVVIVSCIRFSMYDIVFPALFHIYSLRHNIKEAISRTNLRAHITEWNQSNKWKRTPRCDNMCRGASESIKIQSLGIECNVKWPTKEIVKGCEGYQICGKMCWRKRWTHDTAHTSSTCVIHRSQEPQQNAFS